MPFKHFWRSTRYGFSATEAINVDPCWKRLRPRTFISDVYPSARWVGALATQHYERQEFEDLAYWVPRYGKAFYTTQPRAKS